MPLGWRPADCDIALTSPHVYDTLAGELHLFDEIAVLCFMVITVN